MAVDSNPRVGAAVGRAVRVALIGGGFSGIMTASHLLRHPGAGVEVVIFESASELGRGRAYVSSNHRHLLNAPVKAMSAWPDRPDAFAEWARLNVDDDPGRFVARASYGDYLSDVCRELMASDGPRFRHRQCEVVGLEHHGSDGWTVRTGLNESHAFDAVVLATGAEPRIPDAVPGAVLERGRVLCDPLADNALEAVDPDDRVVILGTGLTMIDVALSLRARGHREPIWALSRRGLVPQSHPASPSGVGGVPPLDAILHGPNSPQAIGRAIRRVVRQHAANGGCWQEVMDALRPHWPELWRRMDTHQRRRFLTRLAPFWDVHRHRCAPEIGFAAAALQRGGFLRVGRGSLLGVRHVRHRLELLLQLHQPDRVITQTASRLILCTGQEIDPCRMRSRMWRALVQSGCVAPDPLGLGVRTDDHGRAIRADGRAWPSLFVIGAMRRGDVWESTAVPELREHARQLAGAILESCTAVRV